MAQIFIEPAEESQALMQLVQTAIQNEISKLELGIRLANDRLSRFEEKYDVTSEHFIATMAAEDLEGGDNEYIDWAGEYDLREGLKAKLIPLKNIQYAK